MFRFFISYLYYYRKAKSEHGIHSPFVFNWVSKCFYDTKLYEAYIQLHTHRKELLNHSECIEVTDFGAGSRIFNSTKRSISKIAKTAGISKKRAHLLFRITRFCKPNEILEIGTSVGLSTYALALGNPKATLTTLEGCTKTLEIAKKYIEKQSSEKAKINYIPTEFSKFMEQINRSSKKYQLVYFDGNHSKEATLFYFEKLLPTIDTNTIWIFDDIYWSKNMQEAWNEIIANEKVTVSIDTFFWGIIFFREQQQKEHFYVRAFQPIRSKILEKLKW